MLAEPRRWLRRSLHRRAAPLALAIACASTLTIAGDARAQAESNEAPAARADRLFREGKSALEARRFAEACPKLAESQRLDPGTGTLLALALCHEGQGATATAWREFLAVVDASEKGRPDRAALALRHAQALEPTLPLVVVRVGPESQSHVVIRIDGDDVPAATWAKPIPENPGDHIVEARIPGGTPWKTAIHLVPGPGTQVVAVPPLESATTPVVVAAAALAPSPPSAPMDGRRKLSFIVGGSGAGVLVLGAVFGGLALSEHGSATSLCRSSPCSSSAGVSDETQAKTLAWVSDFGVGLGLAGLGAAAYLFFTRDRSDAPVATAAAPSAWPHVVAVPTVGPGGGGMTLTGAW